jgi:hypothetical protein
MARKVSIEAQIVGYFMNAPLAAAKLVLDQAGYIVSQRSETQAVPARAKVTPGAKKAAPKKSWSRRPVAEQVAKGLRPPADGAQAPAPGPAPARRGRLHPAVESAETQAASSAAAAPEPLEA